MERQGPNHVRTISSNSRTFLSMIGAVLLVALLSLREVTAAVTTTTTGTSTSNEERMQRRSLLADSAAAAAAASDTGSAIKIYYTPTDVQSSMSRKWKKDLAAEPNVQVVALDVDQPPCPCSAARLNDFRQANQPHLAGELLKWCCIAHTGSGLLVDTSGTVLIDTLDQILQADTNLAVLNDAFVPNAIHGALLYFHPKYAAINQKVAQQMVEIITTTKLQHLFPNPVLLPRSLYDLIALEANLGNLPPGPTTSATYPWYFFQHKCTVQPLEGRQPTAPVSSYALQSHRLTQNCPEPNGFCCSIYDPIEHNPLMVTKHFLLPYQVLPDANHLPKPLNAEAGHFDPDELPYISTITEVVHPPPETPRLTPNFFEILLQNDCLPSDKQCSDCLRDKKGANCQKCASACPCYCKSLCHVPVEEKVITKSLTVRPPLYARDPSRLIPRIIHQTWFEEVTPEKYPNMSRLIESFKQSGWDYRFYTDDESINFLSTHFPPEVRQAYETLRPGAFKADLFRYCVLLIHGGVYADMDIMLETNLDLAIANDVGFMVPQDEPGNPVDHRMCLWNGFIASAPGHPFLAKVIQTVVNNIRNRFTSVDVDHMFCPNPELSVLHAFDTLFTAGPCILGAMVNKVLGRHGQTSFEAGEMDIWEASKAAAVEKGTDFVIGVDDKPSSRIPGKTIILHQNKWDMGSHRFTLLERNLVVAATDLPDSDDRINQEKPPEHYSKTHVKAGIYGLDKLYTDNDRANEELRFYVDSQWQLPAPLTGTVS